MRGRGGVPGRRGVRRADAPTDHPPVAGGSGVADLAGGGPSEAGEPDPRDRMDIDPSPVPAGVEPGRSDEAGDTTQDPRSLVEVLHQHDVKTYNIGNQFRPDVRDRLIREARSLMEEARLVLGVDPHLDDVALVLGIEAATLKSPAFGGDC